VVDHLVDLERIQFPSPVPIDRVAHAGHQFGQAGLVVGGHQLTGGPAFSLGTHNAGRYWLR
jgi:hypothetical protein